MNKNRSVRLCFAGLLLVGTIAAAPATIGVASAAGAFTLNSAQVNGNANLAEGSELKSGKSSIRIYLTRGEILVIGIDSSAALYRDRLVLHQGAARVEHMDGFEVRAASFRVRDDQPVSQGVVRLNGDALEVGALSGSLRVLNADGILLTRIGAGTASAFSPGDSSGSDSDVTPNNNNRRRKRAAEALILAGTLTALGLTIAELSESSPTSP